MNADLAPDVIGGEGFPDDVKFRDYTSGTKTLIHDLALLYEDVASADVCLTASGSCPTSEALCHSSILAARCSTLVTRIREFIDSDPHNVARDAASGRKILQLELPDVLPHVLRPVLRYIYVGRIRLRSDTVLPVLRAAQSLGISSLVRTASHHLHSRISPTAALPLLSQARELDLDESVNTLLTFISENADIILTAAGFSDLDEEAVTLILKQENLCSSEAALWSALREWANSRVGIPRNRKVSSMTRDEIQSLHPFLRPFLKPGLFRLLNVDMVTFVTEIEPLELLDPNEVLLKYRFEAAADSVPFEVAFPLERFDFLTRIRQQSIHFQSTHPHEIGITESFEILLPAWSKVAHIKFDRRCKLGRYSELTFFANDAFSEKIGSLSEIFAQHRVAVRQGKVDAEPHLSIPLRRFWGVLYSPSTFRAGWGFSFTVTPSIV